MFVFACVGIMFDQNEGKLSSDIQSLSYYMIDVVVLQQFL